MRSLKREKPLPFYSIVKHKVLYTEYRVAEFYRSNTRLSSLTA